MALPKGAENLAGQAKELAAKAAQPIKRRIDDIREQVATQEGLKNIAFTAGGRDPVVGITTGIALGIAALGIGLGVKGLKGAFKGVGRLLGGLPEPEVPEEAEEAEIESVQQMDDTFNLLKEILGRSIDQWGTLLEFKDNMNAILSDILRINESQLFLSEGILTNTARERLEKAREDSGRIETEREALRFQEEMLDELKGLSTLTDTITAGEDGKELKIPIFKKLLGARFLGDFISKLGAGILGGISAVFGGSFFVALGVFIKTGLKIAFRAFPLVLIIGGLLSGIKDAFLGALSGQGVKGKIGGAIAGFLGGVAEFLSFGFLDSTEAQQKLKDVVNSFFGLIGSIGEFIKVFVVSKILPTIEGLAKDLLKVGKALFFGFVTKTDEFMKNMGAKLKGVVVTVADTITDVFSNLMEIVRKVIIGMLQKVPGVGASLAKQFMTPQERVEFEHREQREEVQGRLESIREEQKSFRDKTFKGKEKTKANARLLELKKQEIEAIRELQNLQNVIAPPPVQAPNRPAENLAAIKQESVAMQFSGNGTTFVNAPQIIDSSQTQNISNTMAMPMSVRNTDPSVDRAFASQF